MESKEIDLTKQNTYFKYIIIKFINSKAWILKKHIYNVWVKMCENKVIDEILKIYFFSFH